MATQLTWDDVFEYVSNAIQRESARPSKNVCRIIANVGLGKISSAIEWDNSWSNGVGGGLTLTGYTAPLPIDCLRVDGVEWDGSHNPLGRKTEGQLDYELPGWRDRAGEPAYHVVTAKNVLLSSTPAAPTTGKLVVRGVGLMPDFPEIGADPNPLIWLPAHLQIAPAYFVLAELEYDPDSPLEAARHDKYDKRWNAAFPEIVDVLRARRYEKHTF